MLHYFLNMWRYYRRK